MKSNTKEFYKNIPDPATLNKCKSTTNTSDQCGGPCWLKLRPSTSSSYCDLLPSVRLMTTVSEVPKLRVQTCRFNIVLKEYTENKMTCWTAMVGNKERRFWRVNKRETRPVGLRSRAVKARGRLGNSGAAAGSVSEEAFVSGLTEAGGGGCRCHSSEETGGLGK